MPIRFVLPREARATLLVLIESKIRLDNQIATALFALAPPVETRRRGRDFAAWLSLVPRHHYHSTGGKQRLGATTKMGEQGH